MAACADVPRAERYRGAKIRAGPGRTGPALYGQKKGGNRQGDTPMPDDNGPKIIIDEDWKARAQREKEEASRKAAEQTGESVGEQKAEPDPVSFPGLVNMFSMQGLIALGILVPRDAKEVMVDLDEAKYIIDMLMMLRDKTKGNLTPEEQGLLTESLSQLQQAYVLRAQQLQESAMREAGFGGQPMGGSGFAPVSM